MKLIRHGVMIFLVSLISAVVASAVSAETLVVSAAASLTDAFRDIEPAFEAAHPGVDVVMNFASSGALYRQIAQGAPTDVYASANPTWMAKAVAAGYAPEGTVRVFARNALVLAAPVDNPAGVAGLPALSHDAVQRIGIGTPATVPAGKYAEAALAEAGLYAELLPKFIFCENVRQVLDYLVRGEVDCGFVYRTDAVKAEKRVVIISEVPLKNPVSYPIAVLAGSTVPTLSAAFVAFVTGSEGIALLEARGFQKP